MKTAVPTKNPVVFYYRDPLECLQSLMQNPLFKDHISFCPFRLYESAAKATRTYTEWLSGDAAWFMQVRYLVFSESRNEQSLYRMHCRKMQRSWEQFCPLTKQISQ